MSEKCSRTEAFPVDSTAGRESAFGFRVPDGQRRTNSPLPARACSIYLFRAAKMEIPVDNEAEGIPQLVGKYLAMASSDHSYIYGDFDICPLAPDRPGHIRSVCVSDAEKARG